MKVTFSIAEDGRSITCLICGMKSYNPSDVFYRYCGHCHHYHEFLQVLHAND